MRVLPVLIALLILPLAAAQPEIDSAHHVRIAYGDIPITTLVESDGQWNIQETFELAVNASMQWTLPAGHALDGTGCQGCQSSTDNSEAPTYTVTCLSSEAEACGVAIHHSVRGESTAYGMTQALLPDSNVVLYSPAGTHVEAAVAAALTLACTDGAPCTINRFDTAGLDEFWFTVAPAAPDTTVVTPAAGGFGYLELVLGLAAGAAIWFLLVKQGLVQKRQRRQVAAEAVHKTAAKSESKETLEGRKRALMAALKELEVAKMKQEIDTAVYDSLKAEFKKSTVTTMRALEELA